MRYRCVLAEVIKTSEPRARSERSLRPMKAETEALHRHGCFVELDATELDKDDNVLNKKCREISRIIQSTNGITRA